MRFIELIWHEIFDDVAGNRRAFRKDEITNVWRCYKYDNLYESSKDEIHHYKYIGIVLDRKNAEEWARGGSVEFLPE